EKDAKVLILTMHTDRMFVRQSLKAGARGYLVKDAEDTDLVKAVKVVGRGASFFNAEVSRMLLGDYLGEQPPGEGDDDLTRLTGRRKLLVDSWARSCWPCPTVPSTGSGGASTLSFRERGLGQVELPRDHATLLPLCCTTLTASALNSGVNDRRRRFCLPMTLSYRTFVRFGGCPRNPGYAELCIIGGRPYIRNDS